MKKYLKYKKKYLTTKKLIVKKVLDQLKKKNTNSKNKLLGGIGTGTLVGIISATIASIISVSGASWYLMSKSQNNYNNKIGAEAETEVEAEIENEKKISEPENLTYSPTSTPIEVKTISSTTKFPMAESTVEPIIDTPCTGTGNNPASNSGYCCGSNKKVRKGVQMASFRWCQQNEDGEQDTP